MRPRLTILDDYQRVALTSADWADVEAIYDIDVVDQHIADVDELVVRLAGSEVVVAMRERTRFPARTLARLTDVKLIATTGGVNVAIDVAAARDHGITVTGTGGVPGGTAELTFGLLLGLARQIAVEDAHMRAGGWQRSVGSDLAGHTFGLVGVGRLGRRVARVAHAFGMDVVGWSPHLTAERAAAADVRLVDKTELFAISDYVSIHMVLSGSTHGLIGAPELSAMKPTAYLINTSRGPIVDEGALVDALRSGTIAGAGLDVFSVEPLPVAHPLRTLPNTLLTPHLGYVTRDTYDVFFRDVVECVLAWRVGQPIRVL
jgi:phosphoglycerate dehydrogenase-like enzyme